MEPLVGNMTDSQVMSIASHAIWTALQVSGPILIVGLVVGLLVAIFQAVTQIQEQTLVFIPKIIAIVVVLAVAGPWMMNLMTGYTIELFENIPAIVASK